MKNTNEKTKEKRVKDNSYYENKIKYHQEKLDYYKTKIKK